MSFTNEHLGKEVIYISLGHHECGQMAVELNLVNDRYAVLSICCPDIELAEDEFICKTFGDNQGLYQVIHDASLIEMVRMEPTEYGMLPVCRLLVDADY